MCENQYIDNKFGLEFKWTPDELQMKFTWSLVEST